MANCESQNCTNASIKMWTLYSMLKSADGIKSMHGKGVCPAINSGSQCLLNKIATGWIQSNRIKT